MSICTYLNRYIYGGGLFTGTAYQRVQTGEGLVSESVKNGLPIIYVAMNYRLNSKELCLSSVDNTQTNPHQFSASLFPNH